MPNSGGSADPKSDAGRVPNDIDVEWWDEPDISLESEPPKRAPSET